jgi:hypothetical protein
VARPGPLGAACPLSTEQLGRGGAVNTSYGERWHGTNRHFNDRKARKAYTLSKGLLSQAEVTHGRENR